MGKGLGGFVSDLFGSTNKSTAKTPTLDPNAYQYGGQPGGAAAAAGRYQSMGAQAQGRQGEQVNTGETAWDRQQAGQARMGMQGMADQMAARAQGRMPSIAQMQADRQMRQATAAQSSASASARGAGAMVLAQQNAASNTANAHSAISNQAQINAEQEKLHAEQAALGAYGGMRAGDQQSQAQAAQQAQFQAQMNANQRAQNDQFQMGMTGFEVGVNNAQLGAQMNQQAQQSANALGVSGINAGVGGQNAGMNQTNAMGVIGMARDAGSAGMGAISGKAVGGPTNRNQAYLVGEEGPELIIPRNDGYVLTADETRQAFQDADFGGAREYGGIVQGSTNQGLPGVVNAGHGTPGGAVSEAPVDQFKIGADGKLGMDVLGSLKAHSDFATRFQRVGQAHPLDYGGARADGGPVQGYAPSTWGAGGPDVAGQSMALMNAAIAAQGTQRAAQQAQSVESPWQRDVRQVQALRRSNPELVSDDDDVRERRGLAVMGQARKEDTSKPKDDTKKPEPKKAEEKAKAEPKKPDTIDRMQGAPVPEYHAMGGYVAPHLIPVPNVTYGGGRAEGGPIEGVLPLWEPPGQQLHQGMDGRAFYASEPSVDDGRPSLAGMSPSARAPAPAAAPKAKAAPRKMTDDELMRAAEAMERDMAGTHERRMSEGPAVQAREEGGPVEGSGIRRMATTAARWAMPGVAFVKDLGSMYKGLEPHQRVKAMDDAAKMGLGPIAGRALIKGSEEVGEVMDEEEKKKRAAAQAAKK
jgi:hypothetical protein